MRRGTINQSIMSANKHNGVTNTPFVRSQSWETVSLDADGTTVVRRKADQPAGADDCSTLNSHMHNGVRV